MPDDDGVRVGAPDDSERRRIGSRASGQRDDRGVESNVEFEAPDDTERRNLASLSGGRPPNFKEKVMDVAEEVGELVRSGAESTPAFQGDMDMGGGGTETRPQQPRQPRQQQRQRPQKPRRPTFVPFDETGGDGQAGAGGFDPFEDFGDPFSVGGATESTPQREERGNLYTKTQNLEDVIRYRRRHKNDETTLVQVREDENGVWTARAFDYSPRGRVIAYTVIPPQTTRKKEVEKAVERWMKANPRGVDPNAGGNGGASFGFF
jgi:hypothetical protein